MSTLAQSGQKPSEVLRARRQEVIDFLSARGVTNVRVFGSAARGEDNIGSDIDLLVTVPSGMGAEFFSLEEDLRDLLGINVDVVSEGGLKPKHEQIRQDARPL